MDHYQRLGVPRNCNRDTLHQAFRELSKKFHPDRFPEAERRAAETRYQQIVIAFNKLKDPRQRKAYDQTLEQPAAAREPAQKDPRSMAENYFKTGMGKYESGDYQAAVEAFKRAVHYQEEAEYYYYKGMAESHINKLHKESVVSLQKAVAKNPRNAKYYAELAKLFSGYGLHTRARTVIEKAVQLFPGNKEILTLARQLAPEKDSKKSGLLGGIFGRKKGE